MRDLHTSDGFDNLQFCLYVGSAIILAIGLGCAVLIYYTSGPSRDEAVAYELGNDGTIYPVMPEDSKHHLAIMERYGGKANILADELRRRFVGLWQGRSLAFTIGCLAILGSLSVFCVGYHMSDRNME